MKNRITFPTYLLGLAMIMLAFSACSSGTHLTKCPDFKSYQEQAVASKKKTKKTKKSFDKRTNVNEQIANVSYEKVQKGEPVALLNTNEVLEITGNEIAAINIPQAVKPIIIDEITNKEEIELSMEVQKYVDEFNSLTKVEQKAKKKEMRKAVKSAVKEAKKSSNHSGVSDNQLLLIIIAILLPPLAMLLYEDGATNRFWISLLLWLLFYLPGLIYSLYIILTDS